MATAAHNEQDDLLASLTASFNANHISQEAVDLDMLQVIIALLYRHYSHANT